MRKTAKLVKQLITELEKHGNVFNACSKLGLSTSTYYRWRKDDAVFGSKADRAIEIGRLNMTDFAESKLLQNIKSGNQRAIEFQLKGNDKRYTSYNHKLAIEAIDQFKKDNDISDRIRQLTHLTTGLIQMESEETISKRIEDFKASERALQEPADGKYYTNYTEESYIGSMMASGFLEEIFKRYGDELKNVVGTSKVRPTWGRKQFDKIAKNCTYVTYNPRKEYTKEEYKEMRRQEIRDWNREHGVPENEGIDF